MYGGLGKVGLDHEGGIYEENEENELAPTFSTSALKLVKTMNTDVDVAEFNQVEGDCDLLTGDLENINEELEQID